MGEGEKADGGTIVDAFVAWIATIGVVCLITWLLGYQITGTRVLCAAIVAIICLPPSLDPAIQIKERFRKGRGQ